MQNYGKWKLEIRILNRLLNVLYWLYCSERELNYSANIGSVHFSKAEWRCGGEGVGRGGVLIRTYNCFIVIIIIIIIYLFTAIGLLPCGSGSFFTCKQNMKLVTTRFKSCGLHEEHVVATWNLGNHLSICL